MNSRNETANIQQEISRTALCIGIDGGGGSTRGCLIDSAGKIFYQEQESSSNPHATGFEAASLSIQSVVQRLLSSQIKTTNKNKTQATHLMCCLSGVGREETRIEMLRHLKQLALADHVFVRDDASAVLASAMTFDQGIVILAGTGSMVWGQNAKGKVARSDGWGSLLGDESGAFVIGQNALRATLRAYDGRGPQTTLSEKACEHFQIKKLPELIPLLAQPQIPRLEIAQFAEQVVRAAQQMDPVAIQIVSHAVHHLVQSTFSVRKKLQHTTASARYVLGGRLAQTDSIYRQQLVAAILAIFPQDTILCPKDRAELGAARLALIQAGTSQEEIRERSESQSAENLNSQSDKPKSHRLNRDVWESCRKLHTEQIHPESADIDQWQPIDILRLMQRQDASVSQAIEKELPNIAQAVQWITLCLQQGGHLYYLGAGTSGRLGVLDAAECPPTFGTDPQTVQAVIAGGYGALLRSQEGAEDRAELAQQDLEARRFRDKDILVALSASGRTPYVLAGLQYAHDLGARTILISCNPHSTSTSQAIDLSIAPQVGPEILMGSTRLKAGTAQKMILNMLSTASMIGLGKVYRGTMVDMQLNSEKLVGRAHHILMLLGQVDYQQSHRLLKETNGNVKTALVMALRTCSADQARQALKEANGFVAAALKTQ